MMFLLLIGALVVPCLAAGPNQSPHKVTTSSESSRRTIQLESSSGPSPNPDLLDHHLITQEFLHDQGSKFGSITEAISSRRIVPHPSRALDKPDGKLEVITMDKGLGSFSSFRYPTIWSDGVVTLETKLGLEVHWGKQLETFLKIRDAKTKARTYRRRKEGLFVPKRMRRRRYESIQELTRNSINPNSDLVLVSIGKARGRGEYARYDVEWSDGSTSEVTNYYLKANWPEHWAEHTRKVRRGTKDHPNRGRADKVVLDRIPSPKKQTKISPMQQEGITIPGFGSGKSAFRLYQKNQPTTRTDPSISIPEESDVQFPIMVTMSPNTGKDESGRDFAPFDLNIEPPDDE